MPKLVRKLVVFFDICSSTAILEDLIRTENQIRWQNVLGQLKRFLWEQMADAPLDMYKFLGDGWILLFDDETVSGPHLMRLLRRLCKEYESLFESEISDVLSGSPKSIGITMGIDEGSLVRITMNRQTEYVGRALNVAARLQSATKQFDESPAGTLLISKNAFSRLNLRVKNQIVQCSLANVTGGEQYQARRILVHGHA